MLLFLGFNTFARYATIIGEKKALSTNERLLMKNVVTIVKIELVNGATPATHQVSFSMPMRIKTWLRSIMTQRRFNALTILNSNNNLVDKLPLVKVASDFNDSRPNCRNDFGAFPETNLK